MNNISVFPSFKFKPRKLEAITKLLKEKYKDKDLLPLSLIMRKSHDMLAQVRSLKNNTEDIITFAHSLKNIDINILASVYPFEKDDVETLNKIIIILMERYNTVVGHRFWQHYQQSPYDVNIIKILQSSFNIEGGGFLSLQSNIRNYYNKFFNSNNPSHILDLISLEIGSQNMKITEQFKIWKIEENSTLSQEIWLTILHNFLDKKDFLNRQDPKVIEDKLESLNITIYKQLIDIYLSSIFYKDFHNELFEQAIKRLHDPRVNLSRWEGMSKTSIENVKKRFISDELSDFFKSDQERFAFWENYFDYIHDVRYVKDPPIAAMNFGDFVVVEFEHVGNAAYFYMQEGFSQNLSYKLKNNVSVSQLKNTSASYFIHKLNHSGRWPERFDKYIHYYLKGEFHYKH